MRKIAFLNGNLNDQLQFMRDYYYDDKEPEFRIEDYFVDPLRRGSKKFFRDVYDTFDGKNGTQHSLLMTELGELNCAFIDMKNSENILYDYYSFSDHEKFDNLDPVPSDYEMKARRLASEDHVREEVADVLMLLYQFAVLEGIDVSTKPVKELSKSSNLQDLMENLTYNVSCFDHQLNRQARGRADFSPEKAKQHLISAISYANVLAFHMDNKSKIKPVNKYEYVQDDKAKTVQQWFDYKVERTQKLVDERTKN